MKLFNKQINLENSEIMKVLVTGATSYVGYKLAQKLVSENFLVHALVKDRDIDKIPRHKNIKAFTGDLCDFKSILKAIEGCTYVFHTADYSDLRCKKIEKFYKLNVEATQNLLEASLRGKIKKLIYTSTLAVFGPSFEDLPICESQPRLVSYANDYELTKSMSEELIFDYVRKGLNCVILNLTRIYGPEYGSNSNELNGLIKKIAKNDVLIVPSKLEVISNYVFIDDAINAHMLAIRYGKNGEKYIIGGENVNYQKLFENIKAVTKSKINILKINYTVTKITVAILSFISSLFRSNQFLTPKLLDYHFTNRSASLLKAKSQLHYNFTPFKIGLNILVSFN